MSNTEDVRRTERKRIRGWGGGETGPQMGGKGHSGQKGGGIRRIPGLPISSVQKEDAGRGRRSSTESKEGGKKSVIAETKEVTGMSGKRDRPRWGKSEEHIKLSTRVPGVDSGERVIDGGPSDNSISDLGNLREMGLTVSGGERKNSKKGHAGRKESHRRVHTGKKCIGCEGPLVLHIEAGG